MNSRTKLAFRYELKSLALGAGVFIAVMLVITLMFAFLLPPDDEHGVSYNGGIFPFLICVFVFGVVEVYPLHLALSRHGDDLSALPGEGLRNAATYALGCPGHKADLSFKHFFHFAYSKSTPYFSARIFLPFSKEP